MFRRDGDKVIIEMPVDDWLSVLLMFGVAIGWVSKDHPKTLDTWINLVNRLNEGNEDFRTYGPPEPNPPNMTLSWATMLASAIGLFNEQAARTGHPAIRDDSEPKQ